MGGRGDTRWLALRPPAHGYGDAIVACLAVHSVQWSSAESAIADRPTGHAEGHAQPHVPRECGMVGLCLQLSDISLLCFSLITSGPNVTLKLAQGDFSRVVFQAAQIVTKDCSLPFPPSAYNLPPHLVTCTCPPSQVVAGVQAASRAGVWINQSLAAPLPDGWKCELSV